jgi:uncharacterized protein YuzE
MQNEMRNRLIELLKKADKNASDKLITDYEDAIQDNADYLIANGVIAPPCNVGDVVYAYCEYFGILKYLVSKFSVSYMGKENDYLYWEAVAYAPDTDELLDEMEFDIDEIGKYVFFTYEEAEQKLKGGADNE